MLHSTSRSGIWAAVMTIGIGCAAGTEDAPQSPSADDGGGGNDASPMELDGGTAPACPDGGAGCSCSPGATAPCWTGPAADRNRGACHDGIQKCVASTRREIVQGTWGECTGEQKECAKCVAGSQTFSTPGATSFAIPSYETLTVEVWGGGGAGSAYGQTAAPTAGGKSSFNGTVVAEGGASGPTGIGGTASGGTTNSVGGNGGPACEAGYPVLCGEGPGGSAPSGGAGGHNKSLDGCGGGDGQDGAAPGGGGGGTWTCQGTWWLGTGWGYGGGGGGAGASAAIAYAKGSLAVGSSVPVIVGAGGLGSQGAMTATTPGTGRNPGHYTGGDGGAGRVTITWTCP
jgi:hypothetical protein